MSNSLEVERPQDYLTRLAASDLGRAYKSLVVDEMRVPPGAFVVDLGCGPGTDLTRFAEAVGPSGRVLGIDHDPSALAAAARSVSDFRWVSVSQGDIHHLALADWSVDRLHTDRVLQHVANPSAVVGEVMRVLSPEGIAVFAEPDWDTLVIDYPDPEIHCAYRRFITDEVVLNARIGRQIPALCEDRGLKVVRVVPITAVFRDVTSADRVFGFDRVTRRAVDAGYLAAEEAMAWLTHLQNRPLFASVTLFVTVARDESLSGGNSARARLDFAGYLSEGLDENQHRVVLAPDSQHFFQGDETIPNFMRRPFVHGGRSGDTTWSHRGSGSRGRWPGKRHPRSEAARPRSLRGSKPGGRACSAIDELFLG